MAYARPIAQLIEELGRLPGIGPKTAQRLALHLLHRPREDSLRLARAILQAREQVRYCSVCCNLTVQDPCEICTDPRRNRQLICVVEDPKDVQALERTRKYDGLYHVLHGALSPMDGVGPEELRLGELLARLRTGEVREVILATDPDIEGEATALYLARLLRNLVPSVTRLARGLPEGGDLDYADPVTLTRALEGRREA